MFVSPSRLDSVSLPGGLVAAQFSNLFCHFERIIQRWSSGDSPWSAVLALGALRESGIPRQQPATWPCSQGLRPSSFLVI
jgi:hypothetical protein